MERIEEQLILHEGLRLFPYRCTAGKLTIGIGRNLEDKGISNEESLIMLRNDIKEVCQRLSHYTWYTELDCVRQRVIVDMVFNLGLGGFLRFQNTISALEKHDYCEAAKEMLDSRWASQVGQRAERLAQMMRSGEDYTN